MKTRPLTTSLLCTLVMAFAASGILDALASSAGPMVRKSGATVHNATTPPTWITSTAPSNKGTFHSLPASVTNSGTMPRYDHVVVVVMENVSINDIVGNTIDAPYINSLISSSAYFSQSYAVTHPSEPNYLALFSGSTQGVTNDSCPYAFGTDNLGHQLVAAGYSFAGYSETLPSLGYTDCAYGTSGYVRRHNPWVDFTNLPASTNLPYDLFPSDYSQLPTLSFVIPNLCDDMHDCSISTGDSWLSANVNNYLNWAKTHNSLLILTWDEDDDLTLGNHILTLFAGANIKPGTYPEQVNHYNVLRTLEDMYGLAALGNASTATPITDVWSTGSSDFSITASPTAVGVSQASQATDTITLSSLNGFSSSVNLSVSGLPSGMTATFSPASVVPASDGSATSILTLSASPTATVGSATLIITGTSGSIMHNTPIDLTVNTPAGVAYWIYSVKSGMVVDDPRSSTTTNTQLIQYPKTGYNNQKWMLAPATNGSWTLQNVLSGLCVSVENASTSLRAPVVQATCTNGAEQEWQLQSLSNSYELINQNSGQCLNVANGSILAAATLIQYPCQGTSNELWTPVEAN